MDGLQMATLLSLDPYTSKYFKGFAWADTAKLPRKDGRELYILNTDKQEGPGEHWCAAFYQDNIAEFFDPYGNPPAVYGFEKMLRDGMRGKEAQYNANCLQGLNSRVCGYHCVFYAFHRCRGFLLEQVVDLYNLSDMRKNDKMVERFVLMHGSGYKI